MARLPYQHLNTDLQEHIKFRGDFREMRLLCGFSTAFVGKMFSTPRKRQNILMFERHKCGISRDYEEYKEIYNKMKEAYEAIK